MNDSGILKTSAVKTVEPSGDAARELHMLFLVVSHRNPVGVVKKNVCGHQNRVIEDARMDARCAAARLVFELRHSLQLPNRGDAVEDPQQLRVRGDVGL